MKLRLNLKLLRVKHHLTQEELAQKLNCSRLTYLEIERGNRSLTDDMILKLQTIFDLTPNEVLEIMQKEE